MFPLLEQVLLRAKSDGQLMFEDAGEAVGLYLDLLIGDLQIRRVIGRQKQPPKATRDARAARAVRYLRKLLDQGNHGRTIAKGK